MRKTSRRSFTTQMLTLTGAALFGDNILRPAAMAAETSSAGGEWIGRMRWLNEPASATISEGKLVVRAKPKTDFWRKTFYGYITDNGHFFHLPVSGDFVFEARVDGQYAALYDQQVRTGGQRVWKQTDRENNVVHLLRVGLLKRLESSVNSLAKTLGKSYVGAQTGLPSQVSVP